jgi:hypothetical protein
VIDSDSGVVADMLPGTGQLIEKRCFARIRIARQGHVQLHGCLGLIDIKRKKRKTIRRFCAGFSFEFSGQEGHVFM